MIVLFLVCIGNPRRCSVQSKVAKSEHLTCLVAFKQVGTNAAASPTAFTKRVHFTLQLSCYCFGLTLRVSHTLLSRKLNSRYT